MRSGNKAPAYVDAPLFHNGNPRTPIERSYYEGYWRVPVAPPEEDPLTEERARRFAALCGSQAAVLDFGCGSGRGTRLLDASGRQVVGLDISREALGRARQVDRKGVYVQAACDAPLPFDSNTFDAVYSAEVIEHLLDPRAMVSECRRVLKPGGILFLTTPYHGLIKNLIVVAAAFERHFDPTGPHIRFFTANSLCRLLVSCGFAIRQISYLGRFWPVWMNMAVCARKV